MVSLAGVSDGDSMKSEVRRQVVRVSWVILQLSIYSGEGDLRSRNRSDMIEYWLLWLSADC